ncbi:glycosyltransferase family 39 protein [Patescibacteria group bacterium]|nr:glycosyltransferase family 39 protein [Patescibacteria group bacterium]
MFKFTNKTTNIIAGILLLTCFLVCILSIRNMSLTMDEQAHIPSGYSYLRYQDYRLNPEHPPLAKDLSAIPLLFMDLKFPTEHTCWTDDLNGQWTCGKQFIFESGNNSEQMIFWSRVPMILSLILLGWFIFFWTRKLVGNKPALLALLLFSFSPTMIAHGRLVTTDIAAAFGALLASYFWVNFLKKPNFKNIFIAGLTLGIALCLKFSLILLLPSLGITAIIYAIVKSKGGKAKTKEVFRYIGLSALVGIIAVIFVIWPVYQSHTWNYSAERQLSDTAGILTPGSNFANNIAIWLSDKPIIRPVTHYALGLLMATQRVAGGNTVYFMGEVSRNAWPQYFPIMYLLKAPLSFHLLSILALAFWLVSFKKKKGLKKPKAKMSNWFKGHLAEFSLLAFFAIYWFTSIIGNLNIGVRHVIPAFPIVYILISIGLFKFIGAIKTKKIRIGLWALMGVLLVWYVVSSLLAFPLYISYYNELAGGSENGYKYAVDSNYDWGQDLLRLRDFVEEKGIEEISVFYFGGDDVKRILGDKLKMSWIHREEELNHGWIAISATLLQEGRAQAVPGFNQDTTFFNWLNDYEPAGRAGYSIFIYNLE